MNARETAAPPRAQRRRLQFSLRALLVLVTIAAVAFAWLGANVRKTRQQQRFIAQLTRRGFEVESHCAAPGWLQKVIGSETAFLVVDRVLIPVRDVEAFGKVAVGGVTVVAGSFEDELWRQRQEADSVLVSRGYGVLFPPRFGWMGNWEDGGWGRPDRDRRIAFMQSAHDLGFEVCERHSWGLGSITSFQLGGKKLPLRLRRVARFAREE